MTPLNNIGIQARFSLDELGDDSLQVVAFHCLEFWFRYRCQRVFWSQGRNMIVTGANGIFMSEYSWLPNDFASASFPSWNWILYRKTPCVQRRTRRPRVQVALDCEAFSENVLMCLHRSLEKCGNAEALIKKECEGASLAVGALDLCLFIDYFKITWFFHSCLFFQKVDLQSVRKFSLAFIERKYSHDAQYHVSPEPLHSLILNAGIMTPPFQLSAQVALFPYLLTLSTRHKNRVSMPGHRISDGCEPLRAFFTPTTSFASSETGWLFRTSLQIDFPFVLPSFHLFFPSRHLL